MKELKNINSVYLIFILPLIFLVIWLTFNLSNSLYYKIFVAFLGILIIIKLILKFIFLPRPYKTYGKIKSAKVNLPEEYNISIFSCPFLDKYSFLNRKVEILSPLFRKNKYLKIVVSPQLLEKESKKFTEMCIHYEILRYKYCVEAKNYLGLFCPVLLLVAFIESYFVFNLNVVYQEYNALIKFLGPFLIMLAVVLIMIVWNKRVQLLDYKIDKELKKYYTIEEILYYIKHYNEITNETILQSGESKQEKLNQYYMECRIKNLCSD